MRISFVVPPVIVGKNPAERSSGCTSVVYPTPNIYELTVIGCVDAEGYETDYIDCVNKRISQKEVISMLQAVKTDICCIWSVNLSLDNDIAFCKKVLAECTDINILILGPAATYYTDKSLFDERVIVVRGEPEMTVLDFIKHKSTGNDWHTIQGISYLKDGKKNDNPMRPLMKDLDNLPLPARHFIKDIEYRNAKLKVTPYTTMVTSRNCPYHCIYCVPSSLTFAREIEHRNHFGKKPPISFRSVEKVDEELRELHRLGYKAIGFMDDNFIWNEKRTEAICRSLKKYGFVWGCQARVDAISENIARMLGNSGCRYIDLGIESFNEEILKYIKKGITVDQIYSAVRLLKKYNIPVKLNLLIGTSPIETEDSIKESIRKAKELKADQLMINIVAPFPGTEFYTIAKENGWIENGEYVPTDVQRNSILNYPHLSSQVMETLLFRCNLSYFISPHFIWHHIREFRSPGDFVHAIKALKKKLIG